MNGSGATSAKALFPRSRAVADRLGPGPLRHVVETGSTNADLVAEAHAGDRTGAVLVADHQTAGRGRLDRTWEDDPGRSLLVSFRLPASPTGGATAVAAVAAAARAALSAMTGVPVLAKWPNDLVVTVAPAAGKLAGVLAELVAGDEPVVVVGIGINVAPIVRQDGATSVVEIGGPDDRDLILAALLTELGPRLANPRSVRDELQDHSATLGREVRAELPGGDVVEGRAVALDAEGHLVIRRGDGTEITVTSGDVVHLRIG